MRCWLTKILAGKKNETTQSEMVARTTSCDKQHIVLSGFYYQLKKIK